MGIEQTAVITLMTYIRFASYAVLAGMLVIRAMIDRRERALSVVIALYFCSRALITLTQAFLFMGPLTALLADWLTTPLLLALIALFARQMLSQYQWQAHNRRIRP